MNKKVIGIVFLLSLLVSPVFAVKRFEGNLTSKAKSIIELSPAEKTQKTKSAVKPRVKRNSKAIMDLIKARGRR
ncbi:hypothetical protein K9L27_01155 [Candidatus Gracilibacteria bacterium]|nr:hypothetical protein [Candidatus Gracilibacteria bacterium]